MRNIWSGRKVRVSINKIISAVFYTATIICVVVGMNQASKVSIEQEEIELVNQINRAVALCYATEGAYPSNLDYLKINYGLNIDDENYIVHYEIFASNIPPEIKVFSKK